MYRRLRRPRLTLSVALAVTLATTLLTYVLLISLGNASIDRAVGISGLVFGLCTFVLTELRRRESPRKTIYYIGLDDPTFNANVLEGAREELSDGVNHILKVLPLPGRPGGFLEWQERQLDEPQLRHAAAVLVAPCADDDRLWEAILRLMKKGVFVVALDVEPPTGFFSDRGLAPPAFVASDFRSGGMALGAIMARYIKSDQKTKALVCLGPTGNASGASRSSWLLYALGSEGVLDRCSAYLLPSWDLADVVPALTRLVDGRLAAGEALIVYCGDDRIMRDVDRHFRAGFTALKNRLRLVGYDGVLSNTGEFLAEDCTFAVATIDANPRAQGGAAGQILKEVYEGRLSDVSTQRIVRPEVVELVRPVANVAVQTP